MSPNATATKEAVARPVLDDLDLPAEALDMTGRIKELLRQFPA